MFREHKGSFGAFFILVLISATLLFFSERVEAAEGETCTEIVTIIDSEAWTEEIHHDAVTETVDAVWANWAPNNTQGPQDYMPVWPTDERGTWILHDHLPTGHEGPDGVYQVGQGNSPWFYRQAGSVVVIEEAWTEYVEHPEVSHTETIEVECPEQPPVVCDEGSVPSAGGGCYPCENFNSETGICEEPVDECLDVETGEDLCVHEAPPANPVRMPVRNPGVNPASDPVVSITKIHKPGKSVKIEFHSSGAQTRTVTHYNLSEMKQEGM